jgi:hypothetical protein
MSSSHSAWRGCLPGLLIAALCALALGCGTRTASQPQQESRLKALAVLYGQFMPQHRGQPPANEAEFKKFIESQAKTLSNNFGINDPASVLVSERDGKPYGIVYGKPTGPAELAGAPVIAYEQEGVGGKRFVANSLGAVEEVDGARFRQLVPGAP